MSTATWALALVSLVAGAGAGIGAEPAKTHYLQQRDFKIPITIAPEARASISYIQLFVLDADGKTWKAAGSVKPDAAFFPFRAEGDGTYLFKVGVVNLQGRPEPENIADAPIGRKVVVDTVPPQVKILATERQGEDVTVRWEVREPYPDPNGVKLEYQFRSGDQALTAWTPVSGVSPLGQATFKANGTGTLWVRIQASDLAKNLSHWEEGQVSSVAVASATGTSPGGLPAVGGGGAPALSPPGGGSTGTGGSIGGLPPVGGETNRAESGWTPMPPTGTIPVTDPRPPVKPLPDFPEGPGASLLPPPVREVPAPAGGGNAVPPVTASSEEFPGMGASSSKIPRSQPQQGTPSSLPPAKLVNKRQINLDYEVTKFGPSGIKHIDLYVTRDEGRNWAKVDGGEDLPPLAPPPPDPKNPMPVLRRSLAVNLASDGIYGFYLVAVNGANRSGRGPANGDPPQIRVEVDTTPPQAGLYRPEVVPNRPDTLLLRWYAKDSKFGPTPITLEWSENRDGPWQTIAADLPHTGLYGQHLWQVPSGVHQVCLRLLVRDAAGNESEAKTEPILADLSEPEVKPVQISVGPR
jgi:hypothetical protein